MIAESSVVTFLKYLWVGVLIPAFAFLYRKQEKHEQKTEDCREELRREVFTKVETLAEIDHRLLPVIMEMKQSKEARVENTIAVKDLTTLITNLRIDLAERNGESKTRHND